MPEKSQDQMFYSFNAGPIHFVMINTEFYFFPKFFKQSALYQYQWLKADLEVGSTTVCSPIQAKFRSRASNLWQYPVSVLALLGQFCLTISENVWMVVVAQKTKKL